jgi:hypothetical protein
MDGERQHQIAAAVAGRSDHPVETDLARRAERRRHVAVRPRAQDRDRRRRPTTTRPPFNSALNPAMRSGGQSDKSSRVRFLTRPPSR